MCKSFLSCFRMSPRELKNLFQMPSRANKRKLITIQILRLAEGQKELDYLKVGDNLSTRFLSKLSLFGRAFQVCQGVPRCFSPKIFLLYNISSHDISPRITFLPRTLFSSETFRPKRRFSWRHFIKWKFLPSFFGGTSQIPGDLNMSWGTS